MTRRLTITFICDACGRLSEHEQMAQGFHETIATLDAGPRDWTEIKREGGSRLSPTLDYCPTCKEAARMMTVQR